MNLRIKTLVTVGCILIMVLGSIAIFSYFYIEQSYYSLETDQTIQVVAALNETIDDELDNLHSNVRDYAAWNDTYYFALDGNQNYIDVNMRDQVFTMYNIDDILIFNRSSSLIYAKEYDRRSETENPVPDSLIKEIARLNSVQNIFSEKTGTAGIMNSSVGLILIISHPILTDTFDGPATGSMHFIRRINEDFYDEIEKKSGYKISIINSEDLQEYENLQKTVLSLSQEPIATFPYSYHTIIGITLIPELMNKSPLLLTVDVPRKIYQAGHTSVVIFISLLIIASGLIILFVILFFDKVIFFRLNSIVHTLQGNMHEDISHPAHSHENTDELEELAEAIDPVFYHLADIQAQIRKSEEQYRTIFENIQDIFYRVDLDGKIVMISPRGLEKMGYSSPDEMIGKDIRSFYKNPDDRDSFLDSITQSGIVQNYEIALQSKDKSPYIFHANSHFYYDKDGNIAGIEGILHDVTELKMAERKLHDSELSYRELFNSIREAIYILDMEGKYINVNEGAAAMNGYPREYFIGKTPDCISAPGKNDPGIFKQERLQAYATASHRIEFWSIRNNGDIFPQEVSLTRGKYFGQDVIIAIAIDISERKKAEDAIKLANKKLNLLSSITRHDINNQLQALQIYLDMSVNVVSDPKLMAEIIEKENIIAQNLEHQIGFTKDYEDLGVHAPTWQNITAIIKRVNSRLPNQQVTIIPDTQNLEVFADPLLEKVFYNLIQNAQKYGGDSMNTIRISSSELHEGLAIIVEDNGIGIIEEDKQNIFSKGFGRNTGLGLFLSREILSITGITITETGKPGTGARFEIIVPKDVYRIVSSQS